MASIFFASPYTALPLRWHSYCQIFLAAMSAAYAFLMPLHFGWPEGVFTLLADTASFATYQGLLSHHYAAAAASMLPLLAKGWHYHHYADWLPAIGFAIAVAFMASGIDFADDVFRRAQAAAPWRRFRRAWHSCRLPVRPRRRQIGTRSHDNRLYSFSVCRVGSRRVFGSNGRRLAASGTEIYFSSISSFHFTFTFHFHFYFTGGVAVRFRWRSR